MANHLNEEVEEAYKNIINKVKNPARLAVISTAYFLFKKDMKTAKVISKQIKQIHTKDYYDALIFIEEGNLNIAREISFKMKTPWKKNTILAEINLKEGNKEEARKYAIEALLKSRGVQRYSIYKNFESLNLEEYK